MTTSRVARLVSNYRWQLVGLLSLSVFMNYIDRGNLSVAAPLVSQELSIPPAKLGLLLSAFFWTYSLGQIPGGWLVDRFGVKWLYAAAYFLWSATTVLTGFAHTMLALFVLRLFLGMGESVVYPACSRFVVHNFLEYERGRANSLIEIGAKSGPALGTFLGGLLVASWGWRALFVMAGSVSLLWLIPWLSLMRDRGSFREVRTAEEGPSVIQILTQRNLVGTSVGLFCYGYVWYLLLSWLPSYLVLERHLTIATMAVWATIPYVSSGISALICGWASDKLIVRRHSVTWVRKGSLVAGLLLCTAILPASSIADTSVSLALFTLACCGIGFFGSNVWAVTQTLAGPLAAARWSGIQNAAGNMGGVVSPLITGIIVSRTHSFHLAFACAAVISVIGVLCYLFLVGKIAPVTWKE